MSNNLDARKIENLLRELKLGPGIEPEEIQWVAADIWNVGIEIKNRTSPVEGDLPSASETAETLMNIARQWKAVPRNVHVGLLLRIGKHIKASGVKCSAAKPYDLNTWPFAVVLTLLDRLPQMLKAEARQARSRVRPGSPGFPDKRELAKAVLNAYHELTGSLPGDSDLKMVSTPYKHLVKGTFELFGLDGWAYHGRQAVKDAMGKVTKRRNRQR